MRPLPTQNFEITKIFFYFLFFFCKKRILKVISFVCSQELDLSHPMHSKNTYKSRVPFSTEAEKVWNEPFSLSSFACFLGRFSSEFHQHNVPDYWCAVSERYVLNEVRFRPKTFINQKNADIFSFIPETSKRVSKLLRDVSPATFTFICKFRSSVCKSCSSVL